MWAALLLAARDLARYGMLLAGGLDSIRQIADLQPGVGLGFLSSVHGSPAYHALETINGFDVGFLWLLSYAISRAECVRLRLAATAAVSSGLLLHAVRIGFGVLFYR